jgi:hypothetical protein
MISLCGLVRRLPPALRLDTQLGRSSLDIAARWLLAIESGSAGQILLCQHSPAWPPEGHADLGFSPYQGNRSNRLDMVPQAWGRHMRRSACQQPLRGKPLPARRVGVPRTGKASDMKKAVLALATAATIGVTALVTPSPAQAWRGGWGGWGAGLAGGLIAGAVIGGIASNAYAYGPGYGYYGGPGYGYYGGYAPAYNGGYAPAYYGGYAPASGYAPAYYGGYGSSYHASAFYGPRYRRAYYGPRYYSGYQNGW